ncbi:MAG TPA: GNAT family N-acetyltransferase, partial [Gaiellaceae bacterium]|nr:GNAT family N-acetyltransferase [Gaiellaceae bacterium]
MAGSELGSALITLDTSAVFALLDRRDPDHELVAGALHQDRGPYLFPAGILAELAYLVERRLGPVALDAVLEDLETGVFSFDCGDSDIPRIRELVARYADLPLGCSDACVVACAERNGGRVLTLDERHFRVVAREGGIAVVPLAPAMQPDVRPCSTLEEFLDAFYAIGQYFGDRPTEERAQRFLRNLELERMHAAHADGRIVGGAGAFAFDLSVPGGSLPTAGVTVVGVYPTHRRRGVLTAMMRAQLDDVRERGEPLAALWASEERIYGRYGYGTASLSGSITLARDHGGFALPFERRTSARFVDADEALELFPPVWDALRATTPGVFSRSRDWWESRVLADPEERREGGMPKRFVAFEADGRPEAYAIYRQQPSWEH